MPLVKQAAIRLPGGSGGFLFFFSRQARHPPPFCVTSRRDKRPQRGRETGDRKSEIGTAWGEGNGGAWSGASVLHSAFKLLHFSQGRLRRLFVFSGVLSRIRLRPAGLRRDEGHGDAEGDGNSEFSPDISCMAWNIRPEGRYGLISSGLPGLTPSEEWKNHCGFSIFPGRPCQVPFQKELGRGAYFTR